MRLRTNLTQFTAGLLLALGLPLTACGSTTNDDAGRSFPCTNPSPAVPGQETGYESCEGGWVHRPQAAQCQSAIPRPDYQCQGGISGGCSTDADCAGTPNSYCGSPGDAPCQCVTGCLTDADCSAGQICVCDSVIGHCAPASCKTDADCGSGKLCSSYPADPYCGPTTFACQTAKDECASSTDCSNGDACTMVGDHRACTPATCVIGRPFLVGGSERLAEPMERRDWCGDARGTAGDVPAELRPLLARRWTEIALMEHASVAAFARFTLQLLALGAPPGLVLETQRALGDETEHARLCFGLASSYGGRAVGPGPLSLAGALDVETDLETVLRLTVREGCIGETVAAIEAAEAGEHAEDPSVRRVLARITADERRHAELAWRFVSWSLGVSPDLVARVLREELALAAASTSSPERDPEPGDTRLLAHGVVPEGMRREIRRRAIARVVAPCVQALLAVELERAA